MSQILYVILRFRFGMLQVISGFSTAAAAAVVVVVKYVFFGDSDV